MIRSFCKEELRKGRIMNIEKFTDMLLNSLEKMEVPAATVEHLRGIQILGNIIV